MSGEQSVVRQLILRLGIEANEASIAALERQVASLGNQARTTAGFFRNTLASAVGNVLSNAVSYGINAMSGAVRGMIGDIAEMESLEARLDTITGSAEGTAAALKAIQDFAAKTPFSIQQVSTAYIGMLRKGMDVSDQALTSMGDLASSGGSDLASMFGGITSLVDRGTDEILQGITGINFAIKGNKLEATAWDGTKTSIDKTNKAVQEYLVSVGKMKGVQGGMARQSKTLGGIWSNFKDSITLFNVHVGENGLNGALKRLLQQLLHTTAGSKDLAKTLGIVLGKAVDKLTAGVKFLQDNSETITKVLSALGVAWTFFQAGKAISSIASVGEMAKAMRALGKASAIPAAKLVIIGAAIALVALAIEDIVGFTQGKDSIIGGLLGGKDSKDAQEFKQSLLELSATFKKAWKSVKDALSSLDLTPMDLVVFTIKFAVEVVADFVMGLMVIGQAIGIAAAAVYLFFSEDLPAWCSTAWAAVSKFFADAYNGAVEWTAGLIKSVVGAYDAIVNAFAGLFKWFDEKVITPIANAFSVAFDAVAAVVMAPINAIIGTLKGIINSLPGMAQDALPQGVLDWAAGPKRDVSGGIGGSFNEQVSSLQNASANGAAAVKSATAAASNNVSVGQVNVTVQGTTNMTPAQMTGAVGDGVSQGIWQDSINQANRAFGGDK